jgi:hypothetical protein
MPNGTGRAALKRQEVSGRREGCSPNNRLLRARGKNTSQYRHQPSSLVIRDACIGSHDRHRVTTSADGLARTQRVSGTGRPQHSNDSPAQLRPCHLCQERSGNRGNEKSCGSKKVCGVAQVNAFSNKRSRFGADETNTGGMKIADPPRGCYRIEFTNGKRPGVRMK